MPRPTKGPRLGSGPTHQKLMLGGLAAQLIVHERIRTTETKAKRLRPVADRLVTLGKDGSLHARRRALGMIEDREVIHKLFAEVAPRFEGRNGGYTRVLKLGPRQGDAAPMAIIEFVDGAVEAAAPAEAEQRRRRGLRRRKPAKQVSDQAAQASQSNGGVEQEAEIEEEPGVMQGQAQAAEEEAEDASQVQASAGEEAPGTPAEAAEGTPDAPGEGPAEKTS